jgi:hypothetical protein
MFRPNWPSSGVKVVMVNDSAAHCNEIFFPHIAVASAYFWLCPSTSPEDGQLGRNM